MAELNPHHLRLGSRDAAGLRARHTCTLGTGRAGLINDNYFCRPCCLKCGCYRVPHLFRTDFFPLLNSFMNGGFGGGAPEFLRNSARSNSIGDR